MKGDRGENRPDAEGADGGTPDASGEAARASIEADVQLVLRATKLEGEEREAFLRGAAGGDERRLRSLQTLVQLFETDPDEFRTALFRSKKGAEGEAHEQARRHAEELLRRLRQHHRTAGRYSVGGVLGGGMAKVYRAWDQDLRRQVAYKVMRPVGPDEDSHSEASLLRFLEEAQVTSQLDHPGIVPVHELGVDDEDRVYYTMRLVRGLDFSDVIKLARAGERGWNVTRALNVLLRVCEAMAYAHSKGVLHRDLKPSNVRVGRFGEVYVMDWGLARVVMPGEEIPAEEHPSFEHITVNIRSDRRDGSGSGSGSGAETLEGDVLGTPCFMSPEQARGDIARLGPATDVYALGGILYQLLTGTAPYDVPGTRPRVEVMIARILAGPPEPIEAVADDVPAELVSICERAMAREIASRYPSMEGLAEDLRAYLENRVVRAHRVGALVELKKWIRRNRTSASAIAATVLVALVAALVLAWVQGERAREQREIADLTLARELLEHAPTLPSIAARDQSPRQAWIEGAEGLLGRLPYYEAEIEDLRAHGIVLEDPLAGVALEPRGELDQLETFVREASAALAVGPIRGVTAEQAAWLAEVVSDMDARARGLRASLERLRPVRFDGGSRLGRDRQQRFDRLCDLREALARLGAGETAVLDRVRADLALARELHARTVAARRAEWDDAIAAVADPGRCPAYRGAVRLVPQVGLVPLEIDPQSGLYEFWHVASGDRPKRGSSGTWEVGRDTGIVLVLIPGGVARLGGDVRNPGSGVSVELEPFFLSKFEVTQEQWARLSGAWPSEIMIGLKPPASGLITQAHPVESVHWSDATTYLGLWDLTLPTEAQWEYAARAGTQGDRWCDGRADCEASINFAVCLTEEGGSAGGPGRPEAGPDGFVYHAPVGSFPANPFGLHEILGNVAEWCADWHVNDWTNHQLRPGDGLVHSPYEHRKVHRGGGWNHTASAATATRRKHHRVHDYDVDLGVRPARPLNPTPQDP